MRVHQITCPSCSTSLKSKAGVPVGQSLSCPKCKKKFTVEEPDDADVVEDAEVVDDVDEVEEGGRPAAKRKGPPPPPARRRAERDDDEDEEEEDDEPRPKKRRPPEGKKRRRDDDDDDEEEERPRKKKKRRHDEDEEEQGLYRRLRGNVAVRIITWVVLLTVLAVVSYLYYITKIKDADKDKSSRQMPYYAAVGLDARSEVV
jgi:transcription elongation factor Elf1